MSSSAIRLARAIAQGNGLDGLAENDVPAQIITFSAVVTAENVEEYLPVGFES
jgi:ribose transport system substrate-binding protein